MTSQFRYKFRAGSPMDLSLLRRMLPDAHLEITAADNFLSDIEVVVITALPIRIIHEIIELIPNSDIMQETLNLECLYTGEHSYFSDSEYVFTQN